MVHCNLKVKAQKADVQNRTGVENRTVTKQLVHVRPKQVTVCCISRKRTNWSAVEHDFCSGETDVDGYSTIVSAVLCY